MIHHFYGMGGIIPYAQTAMTAAGGRDQGGARIASGMCWRSFAPGR